MPDPGSVENPIPGVSSGGEANQQHSERKTGKIGWNSRRDSLLVAGALLTAGALGTGAVVSGKVFDVMGVAGGTADTLVAKPLSNATTALKKGHAKSVASPEEKQRMELGLDSAMWNSALFEANKLLDGSGSFPAKNLIRDFVITTEEQQKSRNQDDVAWNERRRRAIIQALISSMGEKGWDVAKEADVVQKLVDLKQEKEASQLLAIILRASKQAGGQETVLTPEEKERIWSYYQRNFGGKGVALGEQKYVSGKSLRRQVDLEQQRVRESKARQELV